VRNLDPYFDALCRVPMRGVIVTSRSSSHEFDFVSRFFCPIFGINEDPVTGSAHCCIGPYWAKRLNKEKFVPIRLPSAAASCAYASMETGYISQARQ
jgi:predicted PhzF superfamily epimerase YddE/YHI9